MENSIRHVAIIPDGNRRWAKAHMLEQFSGHEEGAEAVKKILTEALEKEIHYLTIWCLSVDNIAKRSRQEVNFLFNLFGTYFKKLLVQPIIAERGVRVRVIGRWKEFFQQELQSVIRELMDKTESNANFNLTFLMAYSGTDEMIEAVRAVAAQTQECDSIDEQMIKNNLWTRDLPPVDLVIRTGGEPHWSQGFMMWSVADAQLYFTETLWPDFGEEEFGRAIESCAKCERRFGK